MLHFYILLFVYGFWFEMIFCWMFAYLSVQKYLDLTLIKISVEACVFMPTLNPVFC